MKKILCAVAGIVALSLGSGVYAASEEYKAAKEQADADYHTAKAHCKTLHGGAKDDCMKQAKADHKAADAQAKTLK